jgi:hypothetical protein
VVGLIRVGGALPVLRWPLAGAIVAILLDLSDLALFTYLGLGWPPNYQLWDKAVDLAYMTTFLIVALRWRNPERSIAVVLFALRMAGLAAFELTDKRWLLVVFPNAFEFWFVFVAARDHFRPDFELTRRRAAWAVVAVTALKLPQEYLLHINRALDRYALADVVSRLLHRLGGG